MGKLLEDVKDLYAKHARKCEEDAQLQKEREEVGAHSFEIIKGL